MRVLLIDNGTTLLEKLQALIPGKEIIVCQPQNLLESEPGEFDAIILSGSRDLTVVYDSDYFRNEIELIKNANIPIIGICFGCELLAVTFGGTLERLEERHSGIREIRAVSESEILGIDAGQSYEVYEGHRWIIKEMPQEFKVLAESNDGPEIIQHQSLPIWGFQFHPENLVNQTAGDEMFLSLFSKLAQK